ncbi:MAG: tetratricopeptide repeat protein [Planctomycetaceae bacterium]|nr:tetratricopeptide repeat protein [Planctomycetaceae bacterium]
MPRTNEQLDDLVQQARAAIKQRQFTQAIKFYEEVLALDEQNVPALEGLGAMLFLMKEYDQAIERFRKVIRIDPRKADPLINIGAIQNKKGEFAEAIKTLRQALAKDRRSATAYYNLGIAHRGAKQLSMAISAYKEAIRLDPEMAEAYSNLGNALLEMGNHTQAELNFRRALELKPKFERAKQGLLRAQNRSDEVKKSISPFGRLVDTDELDKKERLDQSTMRELSPQERFDDRSTVHRQAKESEKRAAVLLNHLRDEVAPSLLKLARLLSEDKPPQSWAKDAEQLKESTEKFEVLMKLVSQTMDELKVHEETMRKLD